METLLKVLMEFLRVAACEQCHIRQVVPGLCTPFLAVIYLFFRFSPFYLYYPVSLMSELKEYCYAL
jgi:hypothetical protein